MGYLASAARWGWTGIGVFFVGHVAADLAWYWLVTFTVSRGRRLLSELSYRLLIAACALFLLAFGGLFIWRGAQRLGWCGRATPPPAAAPAGPAKPGRRN